MLLRVSVSWFGSSAGGRGSVAMNSLETADRCGVAEQQRATLSRAVSLQ
jgi:hypothetical protein